MNNVSKDEISWQRNTVGETVTQDQMQGEGVSKEMLVKCSLSSAISTTKDLLLVHSTPKVPQQREKS
jgi:hypothetical protein